MVHLIEGDPVPYFSLHGLKHGAAVPEIKINDLPVGPGAILRHQVIGQFKMVQGNDWLNPMAA